MAYPPTKLECEDVLHLYEQIWITSFERQDLLHVFLNPKQIYKYKYVLNVVFVSTA